MVVVVIGSFLSLLVVVVVVVVGVFVVIVVVVLYHIWETLLVRPRCLCRDEMLSARLCAPLSPRATVVITCSCRGGAVVWQYSVSQRRLLQGAASIDAWALHSGVNVLLSSLGRGCWLCMERVWSGRTQAKVLATVLQPNR